MRVLVAAGLPLFDIIHLLGTAMLDATKLIDAQGRSESLGELFGWFVITRQYFDRYRRPVMHTETNRQDARRAPAWLWRQWHNVQMMRSLGVPVLGFTWYSLQDQVDWNAGLCRPRGNINPVGLFDLKRDPRPVAQAYRQLLSLFGKEPLLATTDVLKLEWGCEESPARWPRAAIMPGLGGGGVDGRVRHCQAQYCGKL